MKKKPNELRSKELELNIQLAGDHQTRNAPGTIAYKLPKRGVIYLLFLNLLVIIPAFYSKPPGFELMIVLFVALLVLYGIHKYIAKTINVLSLTIDGRLHNWTVK